MHTTHLLCYIDSPERFVFYRKLSDSLRREGAELTLITSKISFFLLGKAQRLSIYLAPRRHHSPFPLQEKLEDTIDCRSGTLSVKQAEILFHSLTCALDKVIQTHPITGLLNWNGSLVHSVATRAVATHHTLPLLFLEIGNFPGKIFADSKGTNSDASIAKEPELLLRFPVSEGEYASWRARYLEHYKLFTAPPQKKSSRKINPWFALDWFCGYFLPLPCTRKEGLFARLLKQMTTRSAAKTLIPYETDTLPPEFVFLALQVSTDTNVILRSPLDNQGAIRHALAFAREKELPLVLRLHPAETSAGFLHWLELFLSHETDVILSTARPFTLLEKARYGFTINSTLGLEAMIVGKPMHVLGHALYSHWQERHLKHYILGYLIDMPYFSNDAIPAASIRALLERLHG